VQLALVGLHQAVLSLDQMKDDIGVALSGDAGHLIVEAGGRVHVKRPLRHGLLPSSGL
jgi:hypothetical protein